MARHLLRGRMIENIRPRRPTRCLWLLPLQLTQPNNFYHGHTAAPSPCSIPAIALGFRPTVTPKAGPMTPPVPIAAPPTTRWSTSSTVLLIPRICPLGICGQHPSRSPNSRQGSHTSATCPHCRSTLTLSSITLSPLLAAASSLAPVGPHHPHLTVHPTSFHPWSGGNLPPPITNNNNSLSTHNL